MAKLTYGKRKRMRSSSFALKKERKYPIGDASHARNALARVSQHGNADEKYRVRKAVFGKYPSLRGGESYNKYEAQRKRRMK